MTTETDSTPQVETTYPDCYLHVEECRSGQTWIVPMRGNASLNLEKQVKKWVRAEFAGECLLDGKLMPLLQGDYYARIMTDSRPPDSCVSWTSGGFYVKSSY